MTSCHRAGFPVLALDDGRLLEESDIICAYFDQIGAGPPLSRPMEQDNWDYGRLHALARSFVDGIAVWGRETKRSPADQSQTIIAHEQARCQRLLAVWESEIAHPIMQGELCLAQLMLLCGIDSLRRYIGQDLTDGKPALRGWETAIGSAPFNRADFGGQLGQVRVGLTQ